MFLRNKHPTQLADLVMMSVVTVSTATHDRHRLDTWYAQADDATLIFSHIILFDPALAQAVAKCMAAKPRRQLGNITRGME